MTIFEINAKAREAGMSYGKYVSLMPRTVFVRKNDNIPAYFCLKCGAPVSKRRIYCEACAEIRRRERICEYVRVNKDKRNAYRREWRRRRREAEMNIGVVGY